MRIQKLNYETKTNLLEDLLQRSPNQYTQYESRVLEILEHVKNEKDQAVFDYTKQFDGADITADTITVTKEEIAQAYDLVDESLVEIIRKAKENIRIYHEKQKQYSWFDSKPDGTMLGQKVTALQRVGVYVPGGKAVYCTNECHSGKGSRSGRNCDGHSPWERWEDQSEHTGGSE